VISRAIRPRLGGVGLCLAVLLGPVITAPAPAVAASTPGLTITADATYDVLPDEGRVAITALLTATNRLHDTRTRTYSFRTGYLAVLPGTSHFEISGPGSPHVSIKSHSATQTVLKLDLGTTLRAGRSTTLTLRFDLPDPGGAADRAVRISPSLVSFSAWAFATPHTAGASVTVRLPAGYETAIGRGPLRGPTTDSAGREVWTSGRLAAPLDFIADVTADRPQDSTVTTRTVQVGGASATVILQSWPDDPGWLARVGDLVERGLPALQQEIGLAWPLPGPLQIHEALVRPSTGFVGQFDPVNSRIELGYAASDAVVLHELAHAWFNGSLVADRWAAEGFATYYGDRAAVDLGLDVTPLTLAPDLQASAIPLNAWTGTEADPDVERYAEAASGGLATAIATRAGDASLRRVWQLAADGIGAYQPSGDAAEGSPAAAVDWRTLLDLLEDVTGRPFADLWRTWVARPSDLAALDARRDARSMYAAAIAAAAPWRLPRSVRDEMRAWQFDGAERDLDTLTTLLQRRTSLVANAEAAGLTLPASLRTAFEGDAGLSAAAAEADAEQATIDALNAAASARPAEAAGLGAFATAIGLLGADPDARLVAARSSFAAGDLQAAFTAATSARDAWTSAAGVGRSRLLSAGLLLLATILLGSLLWQRRRPRQPAPT
jgi:hypothetical protein